nr:hypothetical protein [Tanacetum cinerariifolium]
MEKTLGDRGDHTGSETGSDRKLDQIGPTGPDQNTDPWSGVFVTFGLGPTKNPMICRVRLDRTEDRPGPWMSLSIAGVTRWNVPYGPTGSKVVVVRSTSLTTSCFESSHMIPLSRSNPRMRLGFSFCGRGSRTYNIPDSLELELPGLDDTINDSPDDALIVIGFNVSRNIILIPPFPVLLPAKEHEEMGAFIGEFKTTNELLLKERNNSLSELEFEVYGLSKAINNAQSSNYVVKGVTTRGGKTTLKSAAIQTM